MSTPITDAGDLALFLERDVEPVRATFLIAQAQAKCERYVRRLGLTGLPDDAADIVLTVAGRAYTNVNSATQLGMGSAYATIGTTGAGGVGGLYLSKSDKAELSSLAGRSGAYSIDILPDDFDTTTTPC